MHTVSSRLKEERSRLGLSQQGLADACNISLRSQQNYEKGDRNPDTDYLAALANLGIDVLYIITGQRSRPTAPTAALEPELKTLIDDYQQADMEGKKIIRGVALQAAQAKKAKRQA